MKRLITNWLLLCALYLFLAYACGPALYNAIDAAVARIEAGSPRMLEQINGR